MRLCLHPDPHVLEDRLLRAVEKAQENDPLAAVLILVPTRRLADQISRRLAGRLQAVLAVEILPHQGLIQRILSVRSAATPRPAGQRLLEALLARVLAAHPRNPLASFVRRRPGARAALLGTLVDLREAGLPARLVREVLIASPRERSLAALYSAYERALEERAARGLVDEAGLARAALEGAATAARSYRSLFHYGAYELIGIHLDLVRALDRANPVTVFLPVAPGRPATQFAEGFARRHLLEEGEPLVAEPSPAGMRGSLLGGRLESLYDESREPPAPLRSGPIRFRHAQGPGAEVRAAVRHALRAVADGTPPEEIALVARDLGRYAAAFETLCEDESLPWTTSADAPLCRDPGVRDLLEFLRILARDLPRAATAAWLASASISWPALLPGEPPPPTHQAERWSRQARLAGGVQEWVETWPAWAAAEAASPGPEPHGEGPAMLRRRAEGVAQMARALQHLVERVEPGRRRRWSGFARMLRRLVREVLPGGGPDQAPSPAAEQLGEILDDLDRLETQVGKTRQVSFAEMVDWLEGSIARARLPLHPEDDGGFRVLDAMQARSLRFRRLFLLGLNAGVFPRPPREDPFLADDARRRLGRRSGRPLPVKGEAEAEERLLLTMLLGAATEAIDVSWQRAADTGRAEMPSLALREIGRIVLGTADLHAVEEHADHVPRDPRESLEDLLSRPGVVSPAEARLLEAFRVPSPAAALEALRKDHPHLLPGLRLLAATESFAPREMVFDARVGSPPDAPDGLSISALQDLARCPLQFFFARRLRIPEAEPEPAADRIAPRDAGLAIHWLLENLYRNLLDEGPAPGGPRALLDRSRRRLHELWPRVEALLAPRGARRLPVLWDWLLRRWRQSVERFLEEDLERWPTAGNVQAAFEERRQQVLDLGEQVVLQVVGRFDRRLGGPEQPVVGEYKTSGSLSEKVKPASMLAGRSLQAPLYRLLAGARARVELLGVGPEYQEDGAARRDDRRAVFDGWKKPGQEESFRRTLRILARLLQEGAFPLAPGRHCSWCSYRLACRRLHPPTRQREQAAPDASDYRNLSRQSSQPSPEPPPHS
ncbi:MAG: PD-(D/E)XK nuclease family protein [Acidobacteriota bacterium]